LLIEPSVAAKSIPKASCILTGTFFLQNLTVWVFRFYYNACENETKTILLTLDVYLAKKMK